MGDSTSKVVNQRPRSQGTGRVTGAEGGEGFDQSLGLLSPFGNVKH